MTILGSYRQIWRASCLSDATSSVSILKAFLEFHRAGRSLFLEMFTLLIGGLREQLVQKVKKKSRQLALTLELKHLPLEDVYRIPGLHRPCTRQKIMCFLVWHCHFSWKVKDRALLCPFLHLTQHSLCSETHRFHRTVASVSHQTSSIYIEK